MVSLMLQQKHDETSPNGQLKLIGLVLTHPTPFMLRPHHKWHTKGGYINVSTDASGIEKHTYLLSRNKEVFIL